MGGVSFQQLVEKYAEVFDGRLGKYKYAKISIRTKEDAKPTFCKTRPIPLAFQGKVIEELERLENEGVITPVECNNWGTSLVPVMKTDGSVRLCGDYRTSVNKYLEEVKYPLPLIEDIFAEMNGGKQFTKLDLSQAYNQFELDEESRKLLAWNTPKGIYLMNRMPFGITSATAIFQRHVEELLKPIKGAINFLDDIIITGRNYQKHIETLEEVLEKLKEAGLKVRRDKCVFLQDEVEYLGHKITRDGLKKTTKRVEAILNAKKPTNKKEVRSLLGMVNYYNKYIPNAATVLAPLYNLLKENTKFKWSKESEEAWEEAVKIITSDTILAHFDPEMPVVLRCDASDVGVGAALLHRYANGAEKPIAFASKKLQPHECKYSTIHKEALAIYFGVRKFLHYICGRKFILTTDHKPILALFGENKCIPQMYVTTMQRWAIYLTQFDYKLEYIKGSDNIVADYLSRTPPMSQNKEIVPKNMNKMTFLRFAASQEWPIDNETVGKETGKDPILNKLRQKLSIGEDSTGKDEDLKPYSRIWNELHVDNDCVLWGYRVVIPKKLQKTLLKELHETHMGIVKMKSLARSYMWWPNINEDIESLTKSCIPCLQQRNDPQKCHVAWEKATKPWERIHIDFLGPFKGKEFLIIVDAFTKWPEVFQMPKITTTATLKILRSVFARFGLCETIVSDNGTSLVSEEMEEFCRQNGIEHKTTPTYNPSSNGLAENGVKNFKSKIKAALLDETNSKTNIQTLICRFLLMYRNTPHCTTKISPAEMMFGRKLRTRFDLLLDKKQTRPEMIQEEGDFDREQPVMIRDYRRSTNLKWIPAKISEREGKVIYKCRLGSGEIWRRHKHQIIPRVDNHKTQREVNGDVTKTTDEGEQKIGIPMEIYNKPDAVQRNEERNHTSNVEDETDVRTPNQPENSSVTITDRPKRVITKPKRYLDIEPVSTVAIPRIL